MLLHTNLSLSVLHTSMTDGSGSHPLYDAVLDDQGGRRTSGGPLGARPMGHEIILTHDPQDLTGADGFGARAYDASTAN